MRQAKALGQTSLVFPIGRIDIVRCSARIRSRLTRQRQCNIIQVEGGGAGRDFACRTRSRSAFEREVPVRSRLKTHGGLDQLGVETIDYLSEATNGRGLNNPAEVCPCHAAGPPLPTFGQPADALAP